MYLQLALELGGMLVRHPYIVSHPLAILHSSDIHLLV